MPVRAEQAPAAPSGVQGDPPVLPIQPFIIQGTSLPPAPAESIDADIALSLFVPAHVDPEHATPAQRGLAVYLLRQAHDNPSGVWPLDQAITAAAARFAALAPAARTAWLTTHLAALRAGSLTPQDIP